MANLVELIKKAAIEAVEASEPTNIVYGTVVQPSPLQIQIDQKITLTKEFIVLTKNVIDYQTTMTVEFETEDEAGHVHKVKGTKTVTINNGLKKDDKVMMIKNAGGQSYIVIDKIGGAT